MPVLSSTRREKKWIDLGLSNSLKVYKWVPGESSVETGRPQTCTMHAQTDIALQARPLPVSVVTLASVLLCVRYQLGIMNC